MARGPDFTARWSEGSWAEIKIIEVLNAFPDVHAVQFGISDGTAFFSPAKMAARGLPVQDQHGKRPDILVFRKSELSADDMLVVNRFTTMSDEDANLLVLKAKMAIESEFSPYFYMRRLESYGKELSFTIKDEDVQPLLRWQDKFRVPLCIVQVYLDISYMLPFTTLMNGIADGSIKKQVERSYNKLVYYPKMSFGLPFATFVEPPDIKAENILDPYGKYTPFRLVTGGRLQLTRETVALLNF